MAIVMAVSVFLGVGSVSASAASAPSQTVSVLTISNSSSSLVSNSVVTPAFNYGPMGGPSIETIVYDEGGLVQNGDVGYAVWELQGYLNQVAGDDGYHIITQDGYFGNDTLGAVKAFQTWYDDVLKVAHQLYIDGIVGSQTYDAIIGEIYG
jgi:hypothetical protein